MNCNRIMLLTIVTLSFTILNSEDITAQNGFQEKKVGHVYHVSIPDYMTKSYKLNDAASLQYLNAAKETYVIVIEDSKDHLLEAGIPFKDPEEFYDHFEQTFIDNTSDVSPKHALTINGYPAVQVEITKPFDQFNVHYLVTVIESDTHFYKMLAWTIEDYKEKYLADFKRIASSFREGS